MNRFRLLVAGMALSGFAFAAETGGAGFELALVDLQGQKKVLGTLPASVVAPRVSPDGTRVVFELTDPPAGAGEPEITRPYTAKLDDLDGRTGLRIPVISKDNRWAVWSHTSDRVLFVASGNASDAIFWQLADGSVQPLYVVDGLAPEGLDENGHLTFLTRTGERDYGISQLDMRTKKVTRLIDQPGSTQRSSHISRDGRWIAYTSDETGRPEVWIEPLPQTGQRFQLTQQGGRNPQWSPDGAQLYYDQGGRIFRIDVTRGDTPRAGAPVQLPITGFQQGDDRRQYDLTPDGKGFVMLFPVGASGAANRQ